jgi:hypothetical protein
MELFHLNFTLILIQIDSFEARQVETDTRNDGIHNDLYPRVIVMVSRKEIVWKRSKLRTIGAHHWIELVELH